MDRELIYRCGLGVVFFGFILLRERNENVAMPLGELAERMGCRSEAFKWRKRNRKPLCEHLCRNKRTVGQIGTRIGRVQVDRLMAAKFFELGAKIDERLR